MRPSYFARVPRPVAVSALPVVLLSALLLAGRAAGAQRSASGPASGSAVGPYERARRLVEQGQGALGRAVADSLVAASPAGSPALAEALWWRATLGADGARAEQDLRRILDEFPASPRVGDVTVRLAQLDIARDRPDVAAPTLAQLVREHPEDPARAQAAYWLARARLELGDLHGACVALGDAATALRSSETGTRQQIGDLRRRLPACDPTSAVTAMPPGVKPPAALEQLGAEAQRAEAQREAQRETQREAQRAAVAAAAPAAAPAAVRDSAHPGFTIVEATPRAATPGKAVPFEQHAPQRTVQRPPTRAAAPVAAKAAPASTPASAGVAVPTPAPAAAPARVAAAPAPTTPPPAASDAGAFAVQVAAFNQRDQADALVTRLRGRGLDARATGAVAPFRVKLGRYATRAAAASARAEFAGQGLTGFVTDAGDGPRRP